MWVYEDRFERKGTMIKKILILLLLATTVHAELEPILPPDKAQDFFIENTYEHHKDAVEWWVTRINYLIEKASYKGEEDIYVDVTQADPDVRHWLERQYRAIGYKVELSGPRRSRYGYISHDWDLDIDWSGQ